MRVRLSFTVDRWAQAACPHLWVAAGRSLLSPLVKTVVGELEPPAVEWRGREALIISIERRFRFLAAPAESVLRGCWPSYREAGAALCFLPRACS